jgi:tyrosine-protein phosphatase YwqE
MVLKHAANFIGTDAHSLRNRPNELLRMIRSFPPNISQRGLERMLNQAPQAVIDNQPVMRSMDSGLLKKKRH